MKVHSKLKIKIELEDGDPMSLGRDSNGNNCFFVQYNSNVYESEIDFWEVYERMPFGSRRATVSLVGPLEEFDSATIEEDPCYREHSEWTKYEASVGAGSDS